MNSILKITNVSGNNYGASRTKSDICYIVVAMTNDRHSGYAYAKEYKKPLNAPKFSYNYIIDKNGKIYQTIDDLLTPFTITTSSDESQLDNKDVLSICLMPTWNGEDIYGDYDSGSNFPTDNIETGTYFILTKARNIGGKSYPIGLYKYNGVDWILEEELSGNDAIKRPMNSNEWSFEQEVYDSVLELVKRLQIKYEIADARVLRVFDFYKTYNPAPFIEDNGSYWNEFKRDLNDLILADGYFYPVIPETSDPILNEEIKNANPNSSIEEIIEQYGPEAGLYEYRCINQDKCPYYQKLMTGSICTLSGLGIDYEGKIKECPYRQKQVKDKSFKGNAVVDLSAPQGYGNSFDFEIGIHDVLQTSVNGQLATTTGNLWHIKKATKDCEWTTYLEGSVDEFKFVFRNKDKKIPLQEGFNVGYWINGSTSRFSGEAQYNGTAGFNGNIFDIGQKGNDKELLEVSCLGWLQYLQYETAGQTITGKTASQIFDLICTKLNIPHKVVDNSTWVCKDKNYFGDTWYKMIEDAIIDTMNNTGEWYIIQPNFGTLEFRNILNTDNIKQLKFSEGSIITDWEYQSSIKDSYNVFIGYVAGDTKENGKTTVTAHAEAKDTSTIQAWGGMMSKVEEYPKGAGEGQLSNWVASQLKFYNSPRRKIKMHCIGVGGVLAGNIIYLEIYDVVGVGNITGCLVVDSCTHYISNSKHMMDLECEIVQDGTLQAKIYNAAKKGEENANKTEL